MGVEEMAKVCLEEECSLDTVDDLIKELQGALVCLHSSRALRAVDCLYAQRPYNLRALSACSLCTPNRVLR